VLKLSQIVDEIIIFDLFGRIVTNRVCGRTFVG
jgi:hypothetical protein